MSRWHNEKIVINPVLGILKASISSHFRLTHPKSKDLFRIYTRFCQNQTKIFSQIAAWTFGMRIENFPRNKNSFPCGQKGRNLRPTSPNNKFSQCVFMESLRPETLFHGRAYKIHKTNPKKGSLRFWHFYPRKIMRRDQSAETQPDNAPIWFMTPSIQREQAALGSFPNYKQRTYLGFGISQYKWRDEKAQGYWCKCIPWEAQSR